MNTFKILTLLLSSIYSLHASNHVSDCPDRDFVNLGKQYPCVGNVSFEGDPFSASGTLVNTQSSKGLENFSHLNGRIVITAAHIFEEFLEESDTPRAQFRLDNEDVISGTTYIPQEYLNYYREFEYGRNSHDIAILVLDTPITSISGAIVSLNQHYDTLLNQLYCSVGYGMTGHAFSSLEIMDDLKRGSFSYAHPSKNQSVNGIEKIIVSEYGEKKRIPDSRIREAILNLQCHKEGTNSFYKKPAGLSSNGDSGGGLFHAETGKLIAVITGGAGPKNDQIEHFVEEDFWETHKDILLNYIRNAQQEFDDTLREIRQTEGEDAVVDFKLAHARPEIPKIINRAMIDAVIGQKTGDLNTVWTENVVIDFHKKWILDTLRTIS